MLPEGCVLASQVKHQARAVVTNARAPVRLPKAFATGGRVAIKAVSCIHRFTGTKSRDRIISFDTVRLSYKATKNLQIQVYRFARKLSFICCSTGCSELPMRSATQVASTSMMSRCSRRDTMGL